jgi:hypothetical protein
MGKESFFILYGKGEFFLTLGNWKFFLYAGRKGKFFLYLMEK